jgi:hypothetical protein
MSISEKRKLQMKKWREENKGYRARWFAKNKAALYEYQRIWRHNNKDKVDATIVRKKIKSPEKFKARSIVGAAIRLGKITREPCSICGEKAEAHHEDYSKPLEVIWLCRKHHFELHKKVK